MSALREFCLKYLLRKEEDEMAVVYATLIIKGKKTIDQVPARLRKQVEEILEAWPYKHSGRSPLFLPHRSFPATAPGISLKMDLLFSPDVSSEAV